MGNVLIAILSITDIGMSLVGCVFFPVNLSSDGVWGRKFCHMQGNLYVFLSCTTFFILGLITYDRYTLLIKNRPLSRHAAIQLSIGAAVFFFAVGALPWITGNSIGMDSVKSFGLACYADGGLGIAGHDTVVAFLDSVFMVIFWGMVWMYYKIFAHLREVFRNSVDKDSDRAAFNREIERKILTQFMIITAFFLVCWVCLALTWFVAPFGYRIQDVHMEGFIGWTCHLNSSTNPLIYGTMNKHLRQAMGKIMPKWTKVLPCLRSTVVKPDQAGVSTKHGQTR